MKPPHLTGKETGRVVEKMGFIFDHQTGSHLIMRHKDPPHRRLTVPNHKEIAKGTLMAIIKQAGLTRDEFFQLLE